MKAEPNRILPAIVAVVLVLAAVVVCRRVPSDSTPDPVSESQQSIGNTTHRPPIIDYRRRTKAELAIEAALERKTSLNLKNVTLHEAMRRLSKLYGIHIIPIDKELKADRVKMSRRFSLKLNDVTLSDALTRILAGFRVPLVHFVKDEVIRVATKEYLGEHEMTVVYGTGHLKGNNAKQLKELIWKSTSGPWMGRPGDDYAYRGLLIPIPGGVVIRHDPVNHREIRAMLERLSPTWIDRPMKPHVRALAQSVIDYRRRTKADRKIENALDATTSLNFDNVDLRMAMSQVATKHDIQVLVLEENLQRNGIDTKTTINHTLSGIRLSSALNIVLSEYDEIPLTFLLDDEVLKILPVVETSEEFKTVVYKVGHLKNIACRKLIHILLAGSNMNWSVDQVGDFWGGEGVFGEMAIVNGGLVVRHDPMAHEQVRSILDQLTRQQADYALLYKKNSAACGCCGDIRPEGVDVNAPEKPFPADKKQTVVKFRFTERTKTELKIERTLDEGTDLRFDGVTLQTAMRHIGKKHGIPVIVRKEELTDHFGFDLDRKIHLSVESVHLRSALNLILDQFNFDARYYVRNNALIISSYFDDEENPTTREYSTKKLPRNAPDVILRGFEVGAGYAIQFKQHRFTDNIFGEVIEEYTNTVPVEGGFIVKTSHEHHRRIREVLRQLKALQADVMKGKQ